MVFELPGGDSSGFVDVGGLRLRFLVFLERPSFNRILIVEVVFPLVEEFTMMWMYWVTLKWIAVEGKKDVLGLEWCLDR